MKSTKLRSFVKALTWETSGILTYLGIALLSGDVRTTIAVGFIYFPLHTGMYFVHERIWKKVRWGHRPDPAVLQARRDCDQRVAAERRQTAYEYRCPVCRPPEIK